MSFLFDFNKKKTDFLHFIMKWSFDIMKMHFDIVLLCMRAQQIIHTWGILYSLFGSCESSNPFYKLFHM